MAYPKYIDELRGLIGKLSIIGDDMEQKLWRKLASINPAIGVRELNDAWLKSLENKNFAEKWSLSELHSNTPKRTK